MKTYFLDSSSVIYETMDVEGRVEYHSDHRNATLHAGTFTRSRVKTYILDSSSVIYETMDVEGRVEYHSNHRNCNTPCMQVHPQGVR